MYLIPIVSQIYLVPIVCQMYFALGVCHISKQFSAPAAEQTASPLPLHCQSTASPLPLHCQSTASPLPVKCQSVQSQLFLTATNLNKTFPLSRSLQAVKLPALRPLPLYRNFLHENSQISKKYQNVTSTHFTRHSAQWSSAN